MTDLVTLPATADRPGAARDAQSRQSAGTVIAAAAVAVWAMLVGLLGVGAVVLVGWLVGDFTGASAVDAVRTAVQVYLLAHGGALQVSWGSLGVIPLGLTAVPLWLLVRAGAAVARRRELATVAAAAEAVVAVAIVYAVLAVLLTAAGDTSGVTVSPLRTGVGAGVVAVLGSGIGVLRVTGLAREFLRRIPGPSRALARAVLGGGATLVAAGALVVAIALATDTGTYGELSRAVAPTWTGALGLTLLGLLLLPNAIALAVSVAVGPGFAVGAGTLVSAWRVHLDGVPALPLLAALPGGQRPPLLAVASLAAPLLAGIAIGVVLVRRLDSDDTRGGLSSAGWSAIAGVVVGALTGLAVGVSGGSLGSEQLAGIGASGWLVAAAGAAELAVVAAFSAGLLRWWERRHR